MSPIAHIELPSVECVTISSAEAKREGSEKKSPELTRIGNFHGGQMWSTCPGFIGDMSVTTNYQGPPARALQASIDAMAHMAHYPDQGCGEARQALAEWLGNKLSTSQILLGNGASELIELAVRLAPAGAFRPGPYAGQYSEYERAATINNRTIVKHDEPAAITCIVRPNSPTGHFMTTDKLRRYLQASTGVVVVDESFLPFMGSEWLENSAINLLSDFPDRLLIIMSLTKIWSCPGLRMGAVYGSPEWIARLAHSQVPWSLNTMAQEFIVAATKDDAYMRETWTTIPIWKQRIHQRLDALKLHYNRASPLWVPWVYVDCGSEAIAQKIFDVGFAVGVPVRHCASHGLPSCIRLGIRSPLCQNTLFDAVAALPEIQALSVVHENPTLMGEFFP